MTTRQPDPLLEAVLHAPIPDDGRILVAVSGGPDSMGLLDALVRAVNIGARHWRLRMAHINHCLRGDESDDDERFVRARAEEYGLPLDIARVDVLSAARAQHLSVETAARQMRYDALRGMLGAWGGAVIATGHTADDQVETVLMRLLRGAGVRGLSGIPYATDDLVRPLLRVRKSVVMRELDRDHVPYCLDRSNEDERYHRNALRLHAIPALVAIQPALPEIVGRSSGILARDADLLDMLGREALAVSVLSQDAGTIELSRPVLQAYQPALRRACMSEAVRQTRIDVEPDAELFDVLERILHAGTTSDVQVKRGMYAMSEDSVFRLAGRATEAPTIATAVMPGPGWLDTALGAFEVSLRRTNDACHEAAAVLGPFHALATDDAIRWPLEIRTRRPGDRLYPEHGIGSIKLQDLFVNRKIARRHRDSMAVIADQDGVLWVPGVERDRRLTVTSDGVLRFHLHFTPSPHPRRGKIR